MRAIAPRKCKGKKESACARIYSARLEIEFQFGTKYEAGGNIHGELHSAGP